jgi:endonuclease/exonuclease/phosphatase family metal-dependent hydrolase
LADGPGSLTLENVDHLPGQVLSRLLDRLPFVEAVPAAPPAHQPRRDPLRTFQGFKEVPAAKGSRLLGNGTTLLVHHPRPQAPTRPELLVMTFNILLGGERRALLEQYFARLEEEGRMPDLIGFQEASVPVAVALAEKHGFHLVYSGQDEDPRTPLVNGKALLSRYPLREAAHFTYDIPPHERAAAIARQGYPGEIVEDRGALYALVDVRGQPLAVYNLHHTLGDSGLNAAQVLQLHALVRKHPDTPSLVMGDFNANINVKQARSWMPAPIRRHEPTETVRDYQSRYGDVHPSVGDWGVGNIADVRVRRALHALEEDLPDPLHRARVLRVRLPDGSMMTPDEARQQLIDGKVPRHSEAWLRLQDVADMATLNSLPDERGVVPATGKRFDTFFASPALEPLLLEVDHSTESSDHLPAIATFHLQAPWSHPW